jgi:hypothetical protein
MPYAPRGQGSGGNSPSWVFLGPFVIGGSPELVQKIKDTLR